MNNNTTPLPGTQLAELINDASIDCIIALDGNKKIIAWNKKTELVTGMVRAETMGNEFYTIFPKAKESKEINMAIAQALNGFTVFVPAEKNNYIPGHYEDHFLPLSNNEHVIGVLIIKHDVSHRIKNENELKALNVALVRKNKKLKQLNAEILNFAGVAGNDLKEPLWRSYSLLETVLSGNHNLNDTAKGYLKRVQTLLRRMNLFTDDIAAYLKLGHVTGDPEPVDLNQAMKAAMLKLKDAIANKSAAVKVDALPNTNGYSGLLSQLFYHLLSNALKFQAEGNKPHITVSSKIVDSNVIDHADAVSPKYLEITCTDNGIGISPAHTNNIFQMFYTADKNAYPGTGIGLTACRKIMEIHQGFITVKTGEGGTSFSCYFPAKK